MKNIVFAILAVLLLGLSLVTATGLTATSVVIEGVPGGSAYSTTLIRNEGTVDLTDIEIVKSRVVGEEDSSQKITKEAFTVSPAEFELDADEERRVTISVDIPEGLTPQIYTGEFIVRSMGVDVPFDVRVVVTESVDIPEMPFVFQEIEVDGVDALGSDSVVHVERSSTVDIRAEFMSNVNSDKVRVKAWIGGFEFGDVSDRTGIFTVEPGLIYSKTLHLEIPEDIDLDDDEFRLHVEIFDNDGVSREETFRLGVRKERHSLNIIDTIFFPSNTVEAGRSLRTEVRVENLGEMKEEDVLVKVSIPELGISAKEFIDELVPEENTWDDEEETSDSVDLILFIPSDAETGEYLVEIEVEYNRGHDTITGTRRVFVEGVSGVGVISPAEAIVSVDLSSQNIAQGSEIPYKLMLANLGDARIVYSIDVAGTEGWATTRTSAAFVSVDSNQAGEITLFLIANDDASVGAKAFTVSILANGGEVKQLNLNANIGEKGVTGTGFQEIQRGLLVGFVILVVVLIILGLVIAFKRVGEKPSSEEPESVESQTYY
ncbi:MAG: hypothetical protein ABIB47_02935 [Candidatus Woesearchaeota archaeon]